MSLTDNKTVTVAIVNQAESIVEPKETNSTLNTSEASTAPIDEKDNNWKNIVVIVLSALLLLFLVPWIVLGVKHYRKRRVSQVVKEILEQKNYLLLALSEEGR